MSKVRDIVIDADHILFFVAEANVYKSELGGKSISKKKESLNKYKEHFKKIIADYVTTAEVESIAYNWTIGKTMVILSDDTNFRYDIYPEYKAKRSEKKGILKRLKKWAMKEYIYEPNTEADDVVAYYVKNGALGFTTDKDLFKGVAGIWYNTHYKHRCWVRTNKKDALRFFKCQILAGDPVDEIPSLDGIGLIKAERLMLKYGSSFKDILEIFKDKNKVLGKVPRKQDYSEDYMKTMVRLVCMTQWTPKNGVVLWDDV